MTLLFLSGDLMLVSFYSYYVDDMIITGDDTIGIRNL
jgi:hypothetical protein